MTMNAREIVSLLLEADPPSAAGRTGVYVFGPGLPATGLPAPDMQQVFAKLEQIKAVPAGAEQRRDSFDQLVRAGYTFLIKHDPGNVEVIGKVPVTTTPDGQKLVMQFLGMDEKGKVAHRASPTATVQQLNVDAVLFGSKGLERQQQQSPADNGMTPLDTPFELGLTIDMNSKRGIVVREVHPSGPAAQAGMQAGDVIIGTGKFGNTGPFTLHTPQHLERVLRMGQDTIPFKVRRGDRDHWLPIQPAERKSAPAAQPVHQMIPSVQPNEVSSARETGNQPANISAVT